MGFVWLGGTRRRGTQDARQKTHRAQLALRLEIPLEDDETSSGLIFDFDSLPEVPLTKERSHEEHHVRKVLSYP